jgi:hypothetical protein
MFQEEPSKEGRIALNTMASGMIALGSNQAVRLIGGNDGSLSENIGVLFDP